ncbi:MAG: hypothetical protein LBD28_08065 [Tannerellaceae bacterium]|jgi:hypothetical protein|nr:hypothetical protein [Tannerellaceae bacterium]
MMTFISSKTKSLLGQKKICGRHFFPREAKHTCGWAQDNFLEQNRRLAGLWENFWREKHGSSVSQKLLRHEARCGVGQTHLNFIAYIRNESMLRFFCKAMQDCKSAFFPAEAFLKFSYVKSDFRKQNKPSVLPNLIFASKTNLQFCRICFSQAKRTFSFAESDFRKPM